mmetsp:Transcript_125919/g.317525  ORF Transcript_125919/g.317525 Transcript_125919/m.317525 type:complete len:354 (+) Transcript_125919:52-1113(+)
MVMEQLAQQLHDVHQDEQLEDEGSLRSQVLLFTAITAKVFVMLLALVISTPWHFTPFLDSATFACIFALGLLASACGLIGAARSIPWMVECFYLANLLAAVVLAVLLITELIIIILWTEEAEEANDFKLAFTCSAVVLTILPLCCSAYAWCLGRQLWHRLPKGSYAGIEYLGSGVPERGQDVSGEDTWWRVKRATLTSTMMVALLVPLAAWCRSESPLDLYVAVICALGLLLVSMCSTLGAKRSTSSMMEAFHVTHLFAAIMLACLLLSNVFNIVALVGKATLGEEHANSSAALGSLYEGLCILSMLLVSKVPPMCFNIHAWWSCRKLWQHLHNDHNSKQEEMQESPCGDEAA